MYDWEKFNETTLPEKEHFHSHLNMEDNTVADYVHAKRVYKYLEIKKVQYHDFHVQSNTFILADVFKHFRNICLKIFDLDSTKNVFRSLD